MDQKLSISSEKHKKPSKFLGLIALMFAFSLPFILVKLFPQKQREMYSNRATSLNDELVSILPDNETDDTAPTTIPEQKTEATIEQTPLPVQEKAPPLKQKEWKHIKTRPGDSLAAIFSRLGLSAKILGLIVKDTPNATALKNLKPDQEIQILINHNDVERLILPFTPTQYMVIYKQGAHYKSKINMRKMNSHNHFLTATIQGSLYQTAKRQNIPYKLIQQMTEIFTWDIDFAKDIKAGDQFTIIYKAFYIEDKLVGTGDILAVSYRNNGHTYQAVRHTNRNGQSDYFTPMGTSLKKAFTRYPIRFSHISSNFSLSRYHPMLHYRRPHKGVDLAARIGTPIQATGDGRIEIIGRQNGYGNMIKIKHPNGISTIYGHMLKFQKGISKGSVVRKGQIIGYVGQSGLAAGPHCHYEFHINNTPRNPTTVNLPRGASITGRELAHFKATTNTLLAQLKLYEEGHLASRRQHSKSKRG